MFKAEKLADAYVKTQDDIKKKVGSYLTKYIFLDGYSQGYSDCKNDYAALLAAAVKVKEAWGYGLNPYGLISTGYMEELENALTNLKAKQDDSANP